MTSLNQQLTKIQSHFRGVVTPVLVGKIWELSLPVIFKTKFAQTSLVLDGQGRFYRLHDNGSCNNGLVFHLSSRDRRLRSALMIKFRVQLVANRYYEIKFLKKQPNGVIKNVNNLVNFLLRLNRLYQNRI